LNKVLVLAGCFLLFAVGLGAWPLPPPLETAHLLGKGLASGAPPVPLTDELYALGWSSSNAFAILERRNLGPDRRSVRFRILDLVEDLVLYQEEWPDWGPEEAKGAWWANHQGHVDELFVHYGLKTTVWQLGVFPLILDNEYYSLALRTVPTVPDPQWIQRMEILVHSTGRGLKVVKEVDGYWRWATLLGFLPSPFENRIALVLLVQPSGWWETQQPLRFFITGLSLKAGFPKP